MKPEVQQLGAMNETPIWLDMQTQPLTVLAHNQFRSEQPPVLHSEKNVMGACQPHITAHVPFRFTKCGQVES